MIELLAALAAISIFATAPAGGQERDPPASEWDSPRALELIEQARERRSASTADSALYNYHADARIYVYFYLDREDGRERNLVKTDQLALDVLWQAPDEVKQRIVGWRDRKSLPTNIHYHLDHLTVVQENFGDEIRIGDGDEVRGVPHPAAPGAAEDYHYRLADSLTLRLPGATEPVRVYELQVRPRDPLKPAFVGSVFVEQRAGDIVRMDFTFTPSAYVDRFLDYINISLDNGLWMGRFWLPNQQRVEIRRRIPELDLPVGSVIRANMRIFNYRFNQPLPPRIFNGPAVVAAPKEERESFPFEEDVFAEVREEGLGTETELTEIRREAASIIREAALERAAGVRLRLPRASEIFRYNRAEGAVVAGGVGAPLGGGVRLGARAGYAFGAGHPLGSVTLEGDRGGGEIALTGYHNRPGDIGVGPTVSGAMNTLSSLFAGRDYLDLYYASGLEARGRVPLSPGWEAVTSVRLERQRSASGEADFALFGDGFRPVPPIDEADRFAGAELTLRRTAPFSAATRLTGGLGLDGGILEPRLTDCFPGAPMLCREGDLAFLKPQLTAEWEVSPTGGAVRLEMVGRAGFALGDLPLQEVYLIGGRGTIPGYGYRSFGGDRFATLRGTLAREISRPWITGRLFGAAGWSGIDHSSTALLPLLSARATDGTVTSVGIGVGLFHDIIRVDLARGISEGGIWELVVEANPGFWDFL